jgi:hypothetical protein
MRESRQKAERGFLDSPAPEALSRLLTLLEARVGAGSVDRIWIFPPLVKGRKEWGLVAVSCLTGDPTQRALVTGRYAAELTGTGIDFEPEFVSEGTAPADRLPHVMDGVVRRSDLQLGIPREAEIGGDVDKFRGLLLEYGREDRPDGSLKADHG